MTAIATTARNASLGDLAEILKDQHARAMDVVAPASQIRSENGSLVLKGTEVLITDDGVTQGDGAYVPTTIADEGVADKLGIPISYLRTLRKDRPDLYDANVNGLLHGRRPLIIPARPGSDGDPIVKREGVPGDARSFLVRCFRGEDGPGVARAFLSDRYATLDNLDALTAALDGVRQSGVHAEVVGCDLSDRRMVLKLAAPEVAVMAPELLKGYRNPFSDQQVESLRVGEPVDFGWHGGAVDEPIVWAGFIISNSETGGGAFTIVPRLLVKVCRNGLTVTMDAMRQVHLGGKLEQGIVRWGEDTARKNVELITLKARDAVAQFLSMEYVERTVERLETTAGKRVEKPAEVIKTLGKKLAYSEAQIAGILDMFIVGAQPTAGGVMQAITAYAQCVEDADEAYQLESTAIRAMELAAV